MIYDQAIANAAILRFFCVIIFSPPFVLLCLMLLVAAIAKPRKDK
jgi:hypothetical protein